LRVEFEGFDERDHGTTDRRAAKIKLGVHKVKS
jgi:hypothetical protein